MTNDQKQQTAQQDTVVTNFWGERLANALWLVTLLMVIAFFWQSIEAILTK